MIVVVLLTLFMVVLSALVVRYFFSPRKAVEHIFREGDAYKMVLLIRTDVGMSKGKAAAQCAHAAIAAYRTAHKHQPRALDAWEEDGQAKVTLKVDSDAELVELVRKARAAGVVAESIRDAGRTQLAAGTRTVAAIGPAGTRMIDLITGHLKLY